MAAAVDSCPYPYTNLTGGAQPCDVTFAAWWGEPYRNFQMLVAVAWALLIVFSIYRIYASSAAGAQLPSLHRWTGRLTLVSSAFGFGYAIDPDGYAARVPAFVSVAFLDLSTVSLESFAVLFVFSLRFCAAFSSSMPNRFPVRLTGHAVGGG